MGFAVDGVWTSLASSDRGREYPPASHGVRLRLDVLVSQALVGGVRSGDGVATTLEDGVLPPTAEGVEGSSAMPLLSASPIPTTLDEFNNAVTSIVTETKVFGGASPSDDWRALSLMLLGSLLHWSRPGVVADDTWSSISAGPRCHW